MALPFRVLEANPKRSELTLTKTLPSEGHILQGQPARHVEAECGSGLKDSTAFKSRSLPFSTAVNQISSPSGRHASPSSEPHPELRTRT